MTPTSRLGPLLRAVGALLVLVAIVVGVPLLMAQLNMAPRSLPSLHQIGTALQQRDNGRLAALVLAVGVWICWALFVVSLVPELAAVARGNPARSLPGLGAFQLPASALVAAIVVGFTVAPMIGGLASAAHATTAPPPLPTTSTSSSPAALPSSAAAAHPRPPATVTPGASATGAVRALLTPDRAPRRPRRPTGCNGETPCGESPNATCTTRCATPRSCGSTRRWSARTMRSPSAPC